MKHPQPKFVCPTCGERDNEDVAFICNTCDTKEVKHADGLYYCPECETHMHPFQCRICESKDVAYLSPLTEDVDSKETSPVSQEESPSSEEESDMD